MDRDSTQSILPHHKPKPKNSQVPENCSQVLPHATEQGIELVTERALQVVPAEPSIHFHMPNDGFNRIAPSQRSFESSRKRSPLATHQDFSLRHVDRMPAIALIDHAAGWHLSGQVADLLSLSRQGVAIIGISRKALHADDKITGLGGRHTHFHTKLIRFMSFAFRQTFHFRRMHTIEFAPVVTLLCEKPINAP